MRFLITGSNGFLGSSLVNYLIDKQHKICALVRNETYVQDPRLKYALWNPETKYIDLSKIGSFDVVINLSGANISGRRWNPRWNSRYKKVIWDSRVNTTELLAKSITELNPKPKILINASAMGYYGHRGEEILRENSGPGQGFFSNLAIEWERATCQAQLAGIRVVNLRLGHVLGVSGGIFRTLSPFIRFGLIGRFGSGRQWWPWIGLEDLLRIVDSVIEDETYTGSLNAVSPAPVRQQEFVRSLANSMNCKTLINYPAWLLKLLFGELAVEGLLASHYMVPEKLSSRGFQFSETEIAKTLDFNSK